jgi:hypothetical protein
MLDIARTQAVKNVFGYFFVLFQMFTDNAFQNSFIGTGIPNAFRINDQYRAVFTDRKTV